MRALTVVVAHSVSDTQALPIGPAGAWATRPEELRAFLERRRDWRRGDVAACLEDRGGEGPALLLSFDDGYRDFRIQALPVLEATETPALLDGAALESLRSAAGPVS